MKIESIEVVDLFDFYCYEIEMKKHNPISIIHAPNGYGKTTVFKMIRNVLALNVVDIFEVPFKEFTICLSGNICIKVNKEIDSRDSENVFSTGLLRIDLKNGRRKNVFIELPMSSKILEMIREDGLEDYIQRIEMRRRRIPVEERKGESYNLSNSFEKLGQELEKIRAELNINFIDSNRLFSHSRRPVRRGDRNELRIDGRTIFGRDERLHFSDERQFDGTNENIVRDASDINERIRSVRQKYGLEAEKLDRNFPDRLVEFVESTEEAFSDSQIVNGLEELEKKRLELENAGLVLIGKKSLSSTAVKDETMRKFYTLYIQDTLQKLSYYDDIKQKLELFLEIINNYTSFSNKTLRIDYQKGLVFEPMESHSKNKHNIPLEALSSGEKHDFIMFYELIFNSGENSVFLIDEPEISLHVAWQMEFIEILQKICNLNGMQAIIATHSPDIVNGHDDLLISLGL